MKGAQDNPSLQGSVSTDETPTSASLVSILNSLSSTQPSVHILGESTSTTQYRNIVTSCETSSVANVVNIGSVNSLSTAVGNLRNNSSVFNQQTAAVPVRTLINPPTLKPSPHRQPFALAQDQVGITLPTIEKLELTSGVSNVVHSLQSRIGSTGMPLAGHHQPQNSAASPAAHSLQAHHQQLPVHLQNQSPVQSHIHNPPAQQQQFQRLKVEDALSYLDQVKFKFGSQPQVYNDFLDIMKEFKSQSIDTPGVIQRVSNLFRGHPELIIGFNTFLPPGYKIEVQANEQVNVSMPGAGTCTVTPQPPPNTTSTSVSSFTPVTNTQSVTNSGTLVTGINVSYTTPDKNCQQSVSSVSVHSSIPNQQSNQQSAESSMASPPHSPDESLSTSTTPKANQPVEFNHAINYVNKIKNRFQGQPDIYKQFLEILHTYQKEQRNLKEGVHTTTKPLTEAQVYSQVAKLFQNQEDLLQEFGHFLPDANGAAAILPPPKPVNNDHTPAVKKTTFAKPPTSVGNTNNQIKAPQVVKRPLPSVPHQPAKKPRMTSLKDVTLAEAGKCGTLNEFAFFDNVRKALRSQEAYENFLRCLLLYNQEIVSRTELVQLVTPFLSKYQELFKWFRNFLDHKDTSSGIVLEPVPPKVVNHERERISGDLAMEIDYSSCKRYGASYRALPKNYVHPKCSGRTTLCKEVLNDTWVSFPSWSEDSTFVSSRKTQYEEYIYRCEDERFELDVVLETNLSTVHVLEALQKKIIRMTPEERARLRLDDTLGGSSSVIHQRAIKKVYGDKAADIIEGLKKNPVVAVPLVVKRLKTKEEEWRLAQKSFNKMWRDQNEKYYLKSLDHQGLTFKQNDVKCLRSKNLLNEIETIFEERHEQVEEGTEEVTSGPHLSVMYSDKSVLEDAANLIIHHVKRQTGIHKEDKQKIKLFMRHFIPDFFSVPRGELSDDENEREDDSQTEESKPCDQESSGKHTSDDGSKNSVGGLEKRSSYTQQKGTSNMKENKENILESHKEGNVSHFIKELAKDISPSDNDRNTSRWEAKQSPKDDYQVDIDSSDSDGSYAVLFANNNWYLFLRLHNILSERLAKIYNKASQLAEEEQREKKERKESTALSLRLRPKPDVEVEDYKPAFLEMVKNLLDGNMESNQYEDTLREMFGIDAYLAFTMDRVVQNAVRQLQHVVSDEICTQCMDLYLQESKNEATGGTFYSMSMQHIAAENAYRKKAEQLFSEENCFKIVLYKNEGKLSFELLDTDGSEDRGDERWSENSEKYTAEEDTISDELKEQLSKKPVFLHRNIRTRQQQKAKQRQNFEQNVRKQESEKYKETCLKKEEAYTNEENSLITKENISKSLDLDNSCAKKNEESTDIGKNNECLFDVDSYKTVIVVPNESYLYKRMALKKARFTHQQVSRRLNKKFHQWHGKWLELCVTNDMKTACQKWLLGEREDLIRCRTVCEEKNDPTKPPYAPYNHYRLQKSEKEM
ncbi:paired amphipathic helix protein Sin3a-like [Tachypleus tridentatus]|uniref:paired amphipathic helix protein Sin3a-like n=1 Tax=Tachypleus tridentatus TaxID=6853 RepID=UPI003FD05B11